MIDRASILIEQGASMACERLSGQGDFLKKLHYHDYYELYFLEAGERSQMLQNTVYRIVPGDFMLFSPFTLHRSFAENGAPFQRLILYFRPSVIGSDALREKLADASGHYHLSARDSEAIRKGIEMLLREQESNDPFKEEQMAAVLNLLLIKIARSTTTMAASEGRCRMEEIRKYIDLHHTSEIRLRDLADRFYISEYYLCHEFKKHTNRTVIEYINLMRILHAQRLIAETDDTILSISEQAGFSSLTHFNRIFKAVVGQTPSAFRKQRKKDLEQRA